MENQTKDLRVGDKVNWVIKQRPLRDGFTYDEFKNAFHENLKDDEDTRTSDDIRNIYLKPRYKTTKGTNTIKTIKDYGEGDIMYTLKNGKTFFLGDGLERIPHHKAFAELLNKTYRTDSTITRTGQFQRLGDTVILEYMTSTGNVWVDKTIADQFDKEEYGSIELEIRRFISGRINNVHFGLEINQHIEDRLKAIKDIIAKHS